MKGVNIYPELGTKLRDNTAQIRIRIDLGNQRLATDPTGYKIPVEAWDKTNRKVSIRYPNANYINAIIENKLNRLMNYIIKREALKLPITKQVLISLIESGSTFDSFYEFATEILEKKRLKDGLPYSVDSKRRYRDEILRMKQFRESLSFNQITVQFLEEYECWLITGYKKKDGSSLEKNSRWKALAFIRMVYNEALRAEVILPDHNPFRNFKVGSFETNTDKIKYLELQHLDLIEKYLTNTPGLAEMTMNVGWRFLFMCVSGMRISDAMQLDRSFVTSSGDLEYIPYKTRRHGNKATVPISNERQRRYLNETLNRTLPQTEQKNFRTTFNIHLKLIAAGCGLQHMNLTSHAGRHTMGSFLVDANVDTRPAMAMLGLKSDETLKTYAHLKADKLRSEAAKLGNVM